MPTGIPGGKGSVFYKGASNVAYGRWGKYESPLHKWFKGEIASPDDEQKAFLNMKDAIRDSLFHDPTRADKNKTIAEFVEEYTRDYMKRKRNALGHHHAAILGLISERLGALPVKALENVSTLGDFKRWLVRTPIDVVRRSKVWGEVWVGAKPAVRWTGEWHEDRTPSDRMRGPETINHYMKRLRHMVKYALSCEYITRNPFLHDPTGMLDMERVPEGRKRGVTVDEERQIVTALLKHNDVFMLECFHVALATGVRVGELLKLQRKHIDFDNWTVTLDGAWTKSGKSRVVDIAESIQPIFELRRKSFYHPDDFVFTSRPDRAQQKSFKRRWHTTLRRAGLQDSGIHWHDLRGEAITRMLFAARDAGISMLAAEKAVQEIAGHADISTTRGHYIGSVGAEMRRKVVNGVKR